MAGAAMKARLGALLRRRSQAATEEERLATQEELDRVAAAARPPHRQAETRPKDLKETR